MRIMRSPASEDVPTWKILRDGKCGYRWSSIDSHSIGKHQKAKETSQSVGVSMFRTGSGRPVSVKESSIRKAEAILGGQEGFLCKASGITNKVTSFLHGDATDGGNLPAPINPKNAMQDDTNINSFDSSVKSLMFNTASGRSLSISHDALQRAARLLGESEITKDPLLFSLPTKKQHPTSHVSFTTTNAKPIMLSPCKTKYSTSAYVSRNSQGIPLQTDASIPQRISELNTFLSPPKLPSNKDSYASCNVIQGTIVCSQEKPPKVSCTINASTSTKKCFGDGKKRIGMKYSSLPFKNPRISSWSSVPLNNNSFHPDPANGHPFISLFGISRIYPMLYMERFRNGHSIVRSERMERKILLIYKEKCADITKDIMTEQNDSFLIDNDSEAAKLFNILETSTDPEFLMADMTFEQLSSISKYQEKKQQYEIRQSNLEMEIEKAVENAGFSSREVTPFMRIKVVGLNSKGFCGKNQSKEGVITIWNPTEMRKPDLVEGHVYSVSGLEPPTIDSDCFYLQAEGSTTVWNSITSDEMFKPFFRPRMPINISYLSEVPLASEFDIAVVILSVGDLFVSDGQKRQWVFVTDGSLYGPNSKQERYFDGLLAISFCSPHAENDSSTIIHKTLSGTVLCLYNLTKKSWDQSNHLWVAEATENACYESYHSLSINSHLKAAADAVQNWAKISSSIILKLRERVSNLS